MSSGKQTVSAAFPAAAAGSIPFSNHRLGSWQVAISRRPWAPEELAGRYDAVAGGWARTARLFGLEAAYRASLRTAGADAALALTGPAARVLDCGIGSGSLSLALGSLLPGRFNCHGIDTSRDMLSAADAALRQSGLSPRLKQADIITLPYADRSFDLVMAAHVLEHLPDPRRALQEMTRVLKPGGLLYVCITRRSLFGALVQLRWRTWAVTEREGVAWLRDCGLTDIGAHPVRLGAGAGVASMAFRAQRATEPASPQRPVHSKPENLS